MRILLSCFLFLLGTGLLSATDKPNFVLIFIDDMGYGDIGPFGSTENRTPHLDRMAAEGMKLTSFYAAPVCSASRAQLLTGSYAPRVSVPGVYFPGGARGLNPDEHTVADYLSELGYATGCFGKWHLGDQREFLPTRQGFDTYFGIPYSNDMGRVALENGKKVHPLMRDEEVSELLEDEGQRRITREYTEEAIAFLKKHREQPFFVYLPHTAMHVPLFPHPDFAGKSANGVYGDWVEEVDWSVGQVLDALRDLELEEKTLVLFTSDNGPWASKGKNGGVSGPLRGSKGGTLEGGVREPTIAWWPGQIEPGSSSDAIAGTIDVLPTLVGLAGGELRKDRKIDGRNIGPLLRGETTASPHEAWYYYKGTQLEAVRSGPWKLAIKPQSIGMGFKEQPEDIRKAGLRLYHLEKDLGETTDVAKTHPEVVTRLQNLADAMVADIGSGKEGPGVRPSGVVEMPVPLYPLVPRNRKASPPAGKPIDWEQIQSGDVIPAASAPRVEHSSFSLSARISGDSPKGVVLSHGGSAVGYVLYLKEGHAVFAIRRSNDHVVRVRAPLPEEKMHTIVASLQKSGALSLAIGDGEAITMKSPGPINRHPQEDLSVGHDARNPVDPESPSGSFTGKIETVKIDQPRN